MTIYKNVIGKTVVGLGYGDVLQTTAQDEGELAFIGFNQAKEVKPIGTIEGNIPLKENHEVVIEFANKDAVRNLIKNLSRLL